MHEVIILPGKTIRRYLGSSYDLKPHLGEQDTGAEFWERDTKDKYEWYGDECVRTIFGGLAALQPDEEKHTSEIHDSIDEVVKQLKILNTYMALGHGEVLDFEDTEDA